jgi:hypothetical protein
VFNMIWAIVKPWLHERTLAKIIVLGSDYRETIKEHLPVDIVPEWYRVRFSSLFAMVLSCFVHVIHVAPSSIAMTHVFRIRCLCSTIIFPGPADCARVPADASTSRVRPSRRLLFQVLYNRHAPNEANQSFRFHQKLKKNTQSSISDVFTIRFQK